VEERKRTLKRDDEMACERVWRLEADLQICDTHSLSTLKKKRRSEDKGRP
jgi:hypothetical protein